ncbi:MAG: hypothetical protein HC842_08685 [Cytophagales bacterium]|nr:hypothetical protein [Cytophagales bacterium]
MLELKGKYQKEPMETRDAAGMPGHNTLRNEALTALVTLGFNKQAAEKSIDHLIQKHQNAIGLEELIKLALKSA